MVTGYGKMLAAFQKIGNVLDTRIKSEKEWRPRNIVLEEIFWCFKSYSLSDNTTFGNYRHKRKGKKLIYVYF